MQRMEVVIMKNQCCMMCESKKFRKVYFFVSDNNIHHSDLVQCLDCGHHYSIFKDTSNLAALYEDKQYKVIDTRGSLSDYIVLADSKRILWSIEKLTGPTPRLLDFGCGKGTFMNIARNQGWETKGVETAESRAHFAKNIFDLDVDTGLYESGSIDDTPFDVITLFHVVEHLPHPKRLLKNLVDHNLKDGGLVVIEVPLYESFQSLLAKQKWIHIDHHYHLSHFSEDTLDRLVNYLGLSVVKKEYNSFHVGVVGMTQSIASLLGYRGMLIHDLKFSRTRKLLVMLALVAPFALIAEIVSSYLKHGGVIRVYCKKIGNPPNK